MSPGAMQPSPQPSPQASGSIFVQLAYHGHLSGEVPVKVELLDRRLRPLERRWVPAAAGASFSVAPGMYVVRASLASGSRLETVATVESGAVTCELDLHELSPHESHEWAYLTKPIHQRSTALLAEEIYDGAWLKLWRRDSATGRWDQEPLPPVAELALEEDGVSCGFQTPGDRLYAVQIGGPKIPWKIAAIPSTYPVMLLLRPRTGPPGQVHPLELVVSSDQWGMEGLLSLMQSGDADSAADFAEQGQLAERLLYGKIANTAAAAVGGYFLLRLGDLDRMHSWANNLANWFDWMADGPIIHAWQLILESRRSPADKAVNMAKARERLLVATDRGFPVYTEGLRLLRDGLLLFDRRARQKDKEVRAALAWVGRFTAAADWTSPATTFLGEAPDAPTSAPPTGAPPGDGPLYFVYDVPLDELLSGGGLADGETLRLTRAGNEETMQVKGGTLETQDGLILNSTSSLERAGVSDLEGQFLTSVGPGLHDSLLKLRIHS